VPGTLVLSAWDPEVAPLRRLLGAQRPHGVAIAAVGVGAVDAAVGAARAIARAAPRRIVFVGTAGAYAAAGAAAPIGAAIVAGRLHLVSTAALRGDGYTPAPLVSDAAPDRGLSAALRGTRPRLPVLDVACPGAITRAAALANRIARASGAELENLEVFAVARAAAAAGVAFAAVLGVSNAVGPRAHAQWRAHHLAASEAACRAIARFLQPPDQPVLATAPSPRAPRPR
jgi:purine-nucleoside phosphorylase